MARDNSFLEAALLGYQAQVAQIEAAMADIRRQLGIPGFGPVKIPGLGPFKKTAARASAPRKKHRIVNAG